MGEIFVKLTLDIQISDLLEVYCHQKKFEVISKPFINVNRLVKNYNLLVLIHKRRCTFYKNAHFECLNKEVEAQIM